MESISLARHLRVLGEAQSLEEAADAITAIGYDLGLDWPAIAENFSADTRVINRRQGLFADHSHLICRLPHEGSTQSAQRSCPLFRASCVAIDPFVWRVAQILEADDPSGRSLRGMWQRAAANGVVGGIAIPVHLPRARVGVVGWLSTDPDLDLDLILAVHSHEFRLAGQLFIAHAYLERPDRGHHAEAASLTERELECLTWVALGKTDSEIGELIGRSPSTARFHVDSAAMKLGANNRARAAAVACQMGLINAMT